MHPSSSSTLRSRRLEVMGAGKKKAHDRDTHVSLARPIISCTITSKLPFLFLWGEVLRDNTKNKFPEFICKCTKPAQRQLCYAQPQNGLLVLCSTTRLHIILYRVQHHLAQLDPAPHFLCLPTVLQLQHRTNISKYRIEANYVSYP